MPEPAVVNETVQLGVETTAGVAVPANKLLQSMSVTLDPEGEIAVVTPAGKLFPAVAAPGKEHAEGDVEAEAATYTEIIYPANSALCTGVISTPAGGTLARDHTFSPAPGGGDAFKTYTIERVSNVRPFRFPGVTFTSFGMEFAPDGIDISGSAFGKRVELNVTPTATPTAIALEPILPTHVSVYADSTWAALGTTKLLRCFRAGFEFADRRGMVDVLDSAEPSYVAVVETLPGTTVTLELARDSVGEDFFTYMRAGTTRFIRIEAIGPVIELAITYKLRFDVAMKVTEPPDWGDVDGERTIVWTGQMFIDPVSNKAAEMVVTNKIAAL